MSSILILQIQTETKGLTAARSGLIHVFTYVNCFDFTNANWDKRPYGRAEQIDPCLYSWQLFWFYKLYKLETKGLAAARSKLIHVFTYVNCFDFTNANWDKRPYGRAERIDSCLYSWQLFWFYKLYKLETKGLAAARSKLIHVFTYVNCFDFTNANWDKRPYGRAERIDSCLYLCQLFWFYKCKLRQKALRLRGADWSMSLLMSTVLILQMQTETKGLTAARSELIHVFTYVNCFDFTNANGDKRPYGRAEQIDPCLYLCQLFWFYKCKRRQKALRSRGANWSISLFMTTVLILQMQTETKGLTAARSRLIHVIIFSCDLRFNHYCPYWYFFFFFYLLRWWRWWGVGWYSCGDIHDWNITCYPSYYYCCPHSIARW